MTGHLRNWPWKCGILGQAQKEKIQLQCSAILCLLTLPTYWCHPQIGQHGRQQWDDAEPWNPCFRHQWIWSQVKIKHVQWWVVNDDWFSIELCLYLDVSFSIFLDANMLNEAIQNGLLGEECASRSSLILVSTAAGLLSVLYICTVVYFTAKRHLAAKVLSGTASGSALHVPMYR